MAENIFSNGHDTHESIINKDITPMVYCLDLK